MKYTHRVREEGGSGSPPPPPPTTTTTTIYLRTDDVRNNIHSDLCQAKCPMAVRGLSNGRFPGTKCDFCSEV